MKRIGNLSGPLSKIFFSPPVEFRSLPMKRRAIHSKRDGLIATSIIFFIARSDDGELIGNLAGCLENPRLIHSSMILVTTKRLHHFAYHTLAICISRGAQYSLLGAQQLLHSFHDLFKWCAGCFHGSAIVEARSMPPAKARGIEWRGQYSIKENENLSDYCFEKL